MKGKVVLEGLPPKPVPEKVVNILEQTFEHRKRDAAYLAGMRMTVPTLGELYGVKVPDLRTMASEVVRAYEKDSRALQSVAMECWGRGSREHQLVALFILAKLELKPAERWDLGVRLMPDVSNWESCDQLCMALLGEALAHEPSCMDELEAWVEEENVWVRRAALVAPVYLRRAKYDPEVAQELDRRTLAMCVRLLDDQDNYIRKAVDWTIREVIKRHYELGREWMMSQAAASPSRTARTTLKLAAKKLTQADKAEFLKSLEEV